jgi:hypothetical protein
MIEGFPRRAAEHRAVLNGITVSFGPGQSKDQRTFGRRSLVDQPGSSKEGVARWNATPELVSQDREAGLQTDLSGRDQG